jgi:hypothetical protein
VEEGGERSGEERGERRERIRLWSGEEQKSARHAAKGQKAKKVQCAENEAAEINNRER